MLKIGLHRKKLIKGAYALEGDVIERKIAELRENSLKFRSDNAIPADSVVFLMVANMIKTRHYPLTSEAFLSVAKSFRNIMFVMIGQGQDMLQMQMLAEKHDCLKVVPGCSFEEMLAWYAIADVYVHGGIEPASATLIIGAIEKLPLVSSEAVGCS